MKKEKNWFILSTRKTGNAFDIISNYGSKCAVGSEVPVSDLMYLRVGLWYGNLEEMYNAYFYAYENKSIDIPSGKLSFNGGFVEEIVEKAVSPVHKVCPFVGNTFIKTDILKSLDRIEIGYCNKAEIELLSIYDSCYEQTIHVELFTFKHIIIKQDDECCIRLSLHNLLDSILEHGSFQTCCAYVEELEEDRHLHFDSVNKERTLSSIEIDFDSVNKERTLSSIEIDFDSVNKERTLSSIEIEHVCTDKATVNLCTAHSVVRHITIRVLVCMHVERFSGLKDWLLVLDMDKKKGITTDYIVKVFDVDIAKVFESIISELEPMDMKAYEDYCLHTRYKSSRIEKYVEEYVLASYDNLIVLKQLIISEGANDYSSEYFKVYRCCGILLCVHSLTQRDFNGDLVSKGLCLSLLEQPVNEKL